MTVKGPIFATGPPLPRGPHGLSREKVMASQRARLMAAFTELLAERGYLAVTIGELARRAGVSRATFYSHFSDKQDCLFASYEVFATTLVAAITPEPNEQLSWEQFVERALTGYLETIEANPVAARAYIIEMDAAGPEARRHRTAGTHRFAELFAARHAEARPAGVPAFPDRVYLAIALGVRELVRETLAGDADPAVTELAAGHQGPGRCTDRGPRGGAQGDGRPGLTSSVAGLSSRATIRRRGEVAQLVEHTTENRGVPGSIPGLAI